MMPPNRPYTRLIEAAPNQIAESVAQLWHDWHDTATPRGQMLGAVVLLILITLPTWGGPPLLTIMIAGLWLAYVGQTWNLLAGFTGLFSLGHALFTGIGAYLAAAFALRGGVGPVPGIILAIPVAALVGAMVGGLGCRAGFKSLHFTIVTLILAEGAHLGASHLNLTYLLRPGQDDAGSLTLPTPAIITDKPLVFYYTILALTGLSLLVIRLLLRSRFGYHWLAVREDPRAAAAMGINLYQTRVIASAVAAGLAAPAGAFLTLYLHHADPEQMLSLSASLAPILGTAIGGIGTLFGPVVGAFVVVTSDHGLAWLIGHSHHNLAALKPLAAGLALVLVAMIAPHGLWPALARRLGLVKAPPTKPNGD